MTTQRLACWLVLALGACDGGSGPPESFDDFTNEAEDLFCRFRARCGEMPSVNTCKQVSFDDSEDATLRARVAAGEIDYDPAMGQACLDVLPGIDCRGLPWTSSSRPAAR